MFKKLLLLLTLSLPSFGQEIPNHVCEIQERTVKIEIIMQDAGAQGTGTLIGNGYILTNAHLFPESGQFAIGILRSTDSHFIQARLIRISHIKDFAILKFQGKDYTRPLSLTNKWHHFEPIWFEGNPVTGDFIMTHSKILSYTYVPNPVGIVRPMFVFPCAKGRPGFSGAGIWNEEGQFLGIFELYFPRLNLCGAIPASELMTDKVFNPLLYGPKGDR